MMAAGASATCAFTAPKAEAVVLTFEGIGDRQPVENFYDTAPQDFGIVFSDNAEAIIDVDAGGTGNFGGEPSPDTVLFFATGNAATMNVSNGFDTGFSFFYSAIGDPGFITVYDGLNSTGNVLATLGLPTTPSNGAPDPTGEFSPFFPIGVSFTGTARSVDFGGNANFIGFDNITLSSATPDPTTGTPVPEPSSTLSLLVLGALGAGYGMKRKRQLKA